MTDTRLEELEEAIRFIKWDVIGLCEVRRMGEEIREYDEYIFCFYGEKRGIYGMGFSASKEYQIESQFSIYSCQSSNNRC